MILLEPEITIPSQNRLKKNSTYTAACASSIGVLVLLGWEFDIEFLKRIVPGFVAMNPLTAISFMLTGTVIILLNKEKSSSEITLVWKFFALLTTLIGVLCLLSNLMGMNGGIDQWFFTEKLNDKLSHIHNRMAPNTAFNFILSGISIFFFKYETKRKHIISQYLILVVALISLLSIIGYIYGVRSFYGVLTYIPMAINTSFCFLLISTSIFLSSSDKGFIAEFTNNYLGSVMARKLIPSIVIIPTLLGFMILYGEKYRLYTSHFGMALFTASNILIFAYLIKRTQTTINKADIARTGAEKKMIALNLKLEERTVALEVLNKELESFSYSVSHDLKAPLRYIKGYTKILQEDYAPLLGENGNKTMSVIIRNTHKMESLINDLLEFSRIRRTELQRSACDMDRLVRTVLQEQLMTLKDKEYEIKIDTLYPCSGDPAMIEQVWVNLISNALKYASKNDKPVIEIGSYLNKEEKIYFVKDNGVGFDMEYANKLFAVFQRLHSEKDFEGTGIGLAIVHRIITRHGGRVWAEAIKNEGAQFYFSLPL